MQAGTRSAATAGSPADYDLRPCKALYLYPLGQDVSCHVPAVLQQHEVQNW